MVPSITRPAGRQKAQGPAEPGLVTIKSDGIASGRSLPLLLNVLARSVQVDVLVDMIDPGQRDQMVLPACFRIAFRELDVAGTFQMVDGANLLPVGAKDLHVFLDVSFVEHCCASISYRDQRIGRGTVPGLGDSSRGGNPAARGLAISWRGGRGPGRRC